MTFPASTRALLSLLVGFGAGARPSPSVAEDCRWVFEKYEPSWWETEWRDGEMSGERRDRECEVLATPAEVERSVRLVRATQGAVLRREPVPPGSLDLFSRMVYGRRCDGRDTGERRAQLIEPLVGIVRDPLTICPRPQGVPDEVYGAFAEDEDGVQSKRHLLIGVAAPWSDTPSDPRSWRIGGFEPWAREPSAKCPRARLNYAVDIGASLYGGWKGQPGAVGAKWLVDRYGGHRTAFDWIVSFEYEKHDPAEIYQSVPAALLPHYLYYDHPVEKAPDGKWNPWRILRGLGATADDYVVVKLDIDTPEIENPLVQQVIEDPSLQSLIDELFFEHHVSSKPMWKYWGLQDSPLRMSDTYRDFTALRAKGVRMHSWP